MAQPEPRMEPHTWTYLTPSASYATAFYLYFAGSGKLLTLSQPYGDPDLYSNYNFER
jgi:hypothetical protein